MCIQRSRVDRSDGLLESLLAYSWVGRRGGTPGPVEFRVADDGPGIAPEFHARIFQMFQTLRPRDQVEGSGMGLSMAGKTVVSFGGQIRVESDPARCGAALVFDGPKRVAGGSA